MLSLRMKALVKSMPFLKEAETRETFFKRIAKIYVPTDKRYKKIEKAYNCAKDAFRYRKRESGERYFEHLRMVTLIVIDYLGVTDYRVIIAALLHDIVEDKAEWTIERVAKEFNSYIAYLVQLLTKPPEEECSSDQERDEIYHQRFEHAPREFFLIKIPDRFHNITTIGYCSASKRRRKILETEIHYIHYAKKHNIMFYELREAVAIAKLIRRRYKKVK